jgi:ABC-type antimicrobial peptide transport system permease subunit
MALGARRGQILRQVLGEAARSVAPWIVAGLAIALLIAPATVIFSFGAPFRAPSTYLMAGAVMLLVVLGAALAPALRAARLEPLTVLRGD